MKYILLGSTGVRVSRIALGTAAFGVAPLEKDAIKMAHQAMDLGINIIDTAVTYGNQPRFDRPGVPPADQRKAAEEILGVAMKGRRDDLIICTKVQERFSEGPNGGGPDGGGLTRYHMMNQVERSLRRLQTDHIDVYYAHHPDPTTPLDQTMRVFNDLIRQGKVRYCALSMFPAWQLAHASMLADLHGLSRPVAHQIGYSMVSRQVEQEVIPAAREFGIGQTVASPLAGGLLTGIAATKRSIVGGQRWNSGVGPGYSPEQINAAEGLEELGKKWGNSPAQLALAWLISRPTIACAIVGPETSEELKENASAADVQLDTEQMNILDEIGKNVPAVRARGFASDPNLRVTPVAGR